MKNLQKIIQKFKIYRELKGFSESTWGVCFINPVVKKDEGVLGRYNNDEFVR